MSRTHIALLRAVNVGGTGTLPMARLRALAEGLGFTQVRTHLASGNLLLDSPLPPETVAHQLAQALSPVLGGAPTVVMRDAAALHAVLATQPFADADPARVIVHFLPGPVPAEALATVRHQQDEAIALLPGAIVVHYPQGQGRSRLRVPAAELGTARNLRTVAALLALAQAPHPG